jgi:hypothetical protein
LAWIVPLVVATLGVCIIFAWQALSGNDNPGGLAAFFFFWAILFGYAYVFAIALARIIAERIGILYQS